MKKLAYSLVLACVTCLWVAAQEANDTKEKTSTRTETGCLQPTSHKDQYLLKAKNGSSWTVTSDTASLAEHVGHTVTVTGVVSNSTAHNLKEDSKDIAHDTGMKKSNAEHGKMKVTDVQMVSTSCSQ